MSNYITEVLVTICILATLGSITYCSKIDMNTTLEYNKAALEKGETSMDRTCRSVSKENGAQTAICIEYYKNKVK